MTIAEVKDFITKENDTKEVREMIQSVAVITPEAFGKFLESDDGFKVVRPHFDRYAERAIKTHDEKKREEIEAEISKRAAELGRKEKLTVAEEVSEIKKRLDAKDSELARERTLRQLEAEAAKRKLVLKDEIDIDNPKLTLERGIELLDARQRGYEERETRIKNELLSSGFKPGAGAGNGKPKADASKLSFAEMVKLEEEGKLNELLVSKS
jgi:hypothetical protein